MVTANESEKVIRRLYEITNNYDKGFDDQVAQLLAMGLERFNLDIAILSKIENGNYTVKHCVVPEGVELSAGATFDFDVTYCHITCFAKEPFAIEHVGEDDIYAKHPAYESFGLESYIGMPIKVEGKLYGTLNFSSPDPYSRSFKAVDIDALQLMASWIEVELVRRRQEKTLQRLNLALERKAYEDSLTAIPNRRAMFKHLNSEVNRINREKSEAVLAVIDIDHFKSINDEYGHQRGDEVLALIASTIENGKRDYDYVARFGGEEFLLWLPGTNTMAAEIVCDRIKKSVSALTLIDRKITISVGLVGYRYQGEMNKSNKDKIDELISEADSALYQAKESGRNCIKSFSKVS